MKKTTASQPMTDYRTLVPEEYRTLFNKLVHDLLKDNNWMLPEEAEKYAYQQVCMMSIENLD